MKHFYLFLLALFVAQSTRAQADFGSSLLTFQSQQSPKREVRAVWLTTIGGLDWPQGYARSAASIAKQQQGLERILDRLKAAGINTVLLQTRIRGTVIYPSAYEPWDGCLSGIPGKEPGYDPLQFAIEACHRRGMEIQAWVVTIPMGKWQQTGCKNLRAKHPQLLKKIGEEGFLNPENPATAGYLADLCAEIAGKYDVDGIHLDYIRYPETWNIKVSREEGRQHITRIVEAIQRKVYALKPWVKMSCSPIGKFNDVSRYWSHGWNAYHKVCQDAQGWLKDGLMDELYPMMYFKDNQFYPFAIDWFENSYGKTVAPGLGIYFMDPKEKNWDLDVITRQLYVLRQYKLGNAYFRSKFFTDNLKGLYTFVAQDYNRFPALVPAMTWKSAVPPTAPLQLEADTLRGVLRWLEGKDNSHAPYLLYNVYADTSYPVNTNDAGNLVAVRLRERQISASMRRGLYYAVTAIDRYGNESSAVQLPVSTPKMSLAAPSLLLHNGSVLPIPAIDGVVPRYVAIETMQGTVLASRVVRQGGVPIGDLRAGMYVVRVLKKHAKGSVAGYFSIER